MTWTKRQLINEAYAELALAGYEFDITAEELQTAIRRMDSMIAAWEIRGVRLGYPLPSAPDGSDLDDSSGVPDGAVEAVYKNLAIGLAATFGKALTPETKSLARSAFEPLMWAAAQPQRQQFPDTLPLGAGNKGFGNTGRVFFPAPDLDPLRISQGGDLSILPE